MLHLQFVAIFLPDPQILEKVLLENPDQMVKFKVYQREVLPDASIIDRRLTRVKNKNRLPVGVWAHWVVESISYLTYKEYYIILKIPNQYIWLYMCLNYLSDSMQKYLYTCVVLCIL